MAKFFGNEAGELNEDELTGVTGGTEISNSELFKRENNFKREENSKREAKNKNNKIPSNKATGDLSKLAESYRRV